MICFATEARQLATGREGLLRTVAAGRSDDANSRRRRHRETVVSAALQPGDSGFQPDCFIASWPWAITQLPVLEFPELQNRDKTPRTVASGVRTCVGMNEVLTLGKLEGISRNSNSGYK